MSYMALAYHLKKYDGEKTTFKQMDKNYCQGFVEYLKTATNANNGERLSVNSQWSYMKKLEAVINSTISDEITDSNPFKQIKPENKPKKLTTEVCFLTIEEVNTLVNTPCFYSDIKNGFLFSCFSGLRFSDVKGLTWGKLQKDNIVAHREQFAKLGGVDYTSHFPPNLNPIPPLELMPEWERDYAELQGQMIAGESISFNRMMRELKRIVKKINNE